MNREREELSLHGDSLLALQYMNAKVAVYSEFYCKFSVYEEGRLVNL